MSTVQYSRAKTICDYCGEGMSRHNLKSHTERFHEGKPVKERFKRQSSIGNFLVSKKPKVAEPEGNETTEDPSEKTKPIETENIITLEEDTVETETEQNPNSDDVKQILGNQMKILEGINEIKEMKMKTKGQVKPIEETNKDYGFHELDKARTVAEVVEACPELVKHEDFKVLRCTICAEESDKYETTRYSVRGCHAVMAAKLSWLGFAQPTLASWAFGPDQSGCQTKLAGLRSANIGWLGLRPSQKWLPKFKSGCTHVCSVWAFLKP